MHKITSKPITLECFEIDDYDAEYTEGYMEQYLIPMLEGLRQQYLETQDKAVWKELIRWLPESWLQKRTVTLTYENLYAICSKSQRYFHKLNEWSGKDNSTLPNFIEWVRAEIPYAAELILVHETWDEEKEKENTDFCKGYIYAAVALMIVNECDSMSLFLPGNYTLQQWLAGLDYAKTKVSQEEASCYFISNGYLHYTPKK